MRGIPCVLLDDNNTVSLGSRSIAQGKRTMEIATRLGIAERMIPKGISWSKGNTLIQDKLLYSFDLSAEGKEKYQAFLCLPQYYVESMLVDRAREFAHVDLRWSSRVVGIDQNPNRVRLHVETPEGPYTLEADWVIACDGVRSSVRRALGVPFEGDKFVENFVICDVKMVFNFPPQRMFWFDPTFDKSNISLMHQQPDSIWRVDWQLGPNDDPVEEAEAGEGEQAAGDHVRPRRSVRDPIRQHLFVRGPARAEFPCWSRVVRRRRRASAVPVRRRARRQLRHSGRRQPRLEARQRGQRRRHRSG